MAEEKSSDQEAPKAPAASDAGPSQAEQDQIAAEWAAMADQPASDAQAEDGSGPPAAGQTGRVLDQDEIDNLLGFRESDSEGDGAGGVQTILNSALVSYERLPMLEVVYDRLVRLMSTSLRNFTSDNVEVSIDNIVSVRFGDYVNGVPLPAMLGVFKAVEWDNYGLLLVDSSLIYSIVDVLLGGRRGSSSMRIEGRPYTTIERTLVERMLSVLLDDLSAAFEPLSPVKFRLDRLETNPRFAAIARPANVAVVAKLRVDMEDRGGKIELLLPYATLEPVRDLLLQMFLGERFGRDPIWESHLAGEMWVTYVEIEAVLEERVLKLREVADLKVGSRLLLDVKPQSTILLRCGGVPLCTGRMGRKGERIAIRVENTLIGPTESKEAA